MNTCTELLSDSEIIELFFARDILAIDATDRKYGRLIQYTANGILRNENDAEECKNDTYLAMWEAIPPAKPDLLRAFAVKLARRIAINRYNEKNAYRRASSNHTTSVDELTDVISSPQSVEDAYDSAELGRLINSFLSALTPREQFIFVGRFFMSRTLSELASELRVNASTVKRTLDKIKQKLKKYLEREGFYI